MIEKTAIQLYTLREQLKTVPEIVETLTQVKDIGYAGVELAGLGPIEPGELKKIVDDLGLVICASHTRYDLLEKDLSQVIENQEIWQCRHVVVPSLPKPMRGRKEGFVEFAQKANGIGKELSKAGIKLSYHNHAFEFEKFDGKSGFELIFENSEPEYLSSQLDTYWVQYGGADTVQWCRKLSGRLHLVHLKDYGMIDGAPHDVEVGEGNMNFPAILAACRQAGTEWYIVEMDNCPHEPMESIRMSLENLRAYFGQ